MVLRKPSVKLAGVELAATGMVAWRFQAGVQPFITTFSVHESDWGKLENQKGKPLVLEVIDSRGARTSVRDVFILHEVDSTKPRIVSFRVADRRWRWHRKLVARVYNLRRKTGDTDLDDRTLPLEGKEGIPRYNYRPYSLKGGEDVWTARDALEDCLDLLENELFGGFGGRVVFSSFPATRQQTLENVVLRDAGDAALEQLLAKIPGASVWINKLGHTVVYNQHDLAAAEAYLKVLPLATWDGDKTALVLKKEIRPSKILVHYEREVECLMHYEDDYSQGNQSTFRRNQLYLENVVRTTDPQTTVTEFNPETGENDPPKTVGPGTWVNLESWLVAMDAKHGRSAGTTSLPWTFDTIKRFWLMGNLEGLLVGTNLRGNIDGAEADNTSAHNAVQALLESFRQTYRVSRRYIHRINQLKDVRVALIDPVSGIRMPAAVWGQVTLRPTAKGAHIASRKNEGKSGKYYLVTSLDEDTNQIAKTPPGPQKLTILDPDAGIIRISSHEDPYDTYSRVIPCHVVGADDKLRVPVMALQLQDKEILGAGMRLQNGTGDWFLSSKLKFKVMITIVPGSPNNRGLFHTIEVAPDELKILYPEYRIQSGTGPVHHIYVSPSEATARFGWRFDDEAEDTLERLLGLDEDDPTLGGLVDENGNPTNDMPGLWLVNEKAELTDHARTVAAEAYTGLSDTVLGKRTTILSGNDIEIRGNMTGATLQVAAAPSGKVNVAHDFGGALRPVDRRALMEGQTRKIVLGIVRLE